MGRHRRNRTGGLGFTMTIGLDERDSITATLTVQFSTRVSEIATGQVIGLRVCTREQFETEALRPDFPPLASAADAAEILGVSRQWVHQLAASNTRFPEPVARVGTGPLWTQFRRSSTSPASGSGAQEGPRCGLGYTSQTSADTDPG